MKNNASMRWALVSFLAVAILMSCGNKMPKSKDGVVRIPESVVVKMYASAKEYGKPVPSYKEAPQLAALVKEGKLPSVNDRLPKEPVIVEPARSIGIYGGTYRRAWKGWSDVVGVDKALGERLLLWGAKGELTPGVVRDLELSSDGKTVTMKLREGLKWSDGHPVTTVDVDFNYNKVYQNPDLFAASRIPDIFRPADVVGTLEIIDDYTCIFKFQAPSAGFLPGTASINYNVFLQPTHYLKQFHPEFTNKEELDKLMKESGEKNLQSFFANKSNPFRNPDLPVLMAWQLQNDVTDQQVYFKRNPYYFKVDSKGNQLPYIDEVVNYFVEDIEMLVMKAVSGDLDFQTRDISLDNFTLLMENRDKGNFNVLLYPGADGADVCIFLNHSVQDPVKNELFNNPKFKQAISIGMNRSEISNINHMGMAKARQAAFASTGYIYDKDWEQLHVFHDPKLANKLLDELGLTQKNANGIRLMKNGKPMEITIEFFLDNYSKDLEIVAQQWQEIGVKLIQKLEDRTLMYTRYRQDNSHEAICWTFNVITRPDLSSGHWAPVGEGNGWGGQWGLYYRTKGQSGIKPPADVQRLQDIWDEMIITIDDSKRKALLQEVINIHKKNLFIIGIVGLSPKIAVINKKLQNIPFFIYEEIYRSPGNAYPQQWYFASN